MYDRIRPRRRRIRETAGLILAGLLVVLGVLFLSLNDVRDADAWDHCNPCPMPTPRPTPVVIGIPPATPIVPTLPPTDT